MWHSKSIEDISKTLNTNIKTGLSNSCASKLLNENGKNELTEGSKRSLIKLIFDQINNIFPRRAWRKYNNIHCYYLKRNYRDHPRK